MNYQEWCDQAIFEPIKEWTSCGNRYQLCKTNIEGIKVTERTFFPWNFLKEPVQWYIVDLVLPMDTVVPNGDMCGDYYTDEGYGLPQFLSNLEFAFDFIMNYKKTQLHEPKI
jgi:hypothetical protein